MHQKKISGALWGVEIKKNSGGDIPPNSAGLPMYELPTKAYINLEGF